MMPVVVSRTDIKHRSDRRPANHGFFNARNASLPELPVRSWGSMPIVPPVAVDVREGQKQ